MKNLVLFVLSVSVSLFSLSSSAELKSAKALHLKWSADKEMSSLSANLDKGYHFNDKAPNGFQVNGHFTPGKPEDLTHLTLKGLPLKGEVTVRLYVCDDAVTFCETHVLKVQIEKQVKAQGQPITFESEKIQKTEKSNLSIQQQAQKRIHKNENGFWVNGLAEGLKEAQTHKSEVLIDFGARWCPSCVRLDADIFKNPEFKKDTLSLVKVKIDVDELENSVLLEKYHVQSFPTVVVTNDRGEEVLRFSDYLPLNRVLALLQEARTTPLTTEQLRLRAEKTQNTKDWSQLFQRYYQTAEFSKALALEKNLGKVKPNEWQDALVEEALQRAKNQTLSLIEAQKFVLDVIKAEPSSTRSLRWRGELIEILADEKTLQPSVESLSQETLNLALTLLKDPSALKSALRNDEVGEFEGFENFYVAFMAASALENAHLEPDTRAAAVWSLAYDVGKASLFNLNNKGPSLRWLTCAQLSHQYDEALNLVNALLKKYPGEGDLQRRKLKILVDLRQYKEAIAIGEIALKNAYGVNEMMVVEPLAKAYLGMHENEKAKKILAKYLTAPDWQNHRMQELEKKLVALSQTAERGL